MRDRLKAAIFFRMSTTVLLAQMFMPLSYFEGEQPGWKLAALALLLLAMVAMFAINAWSKRQPPNDQPPKNPRKKNKAE